MYINLFGKISRGGGGGGVQFFFLFFKICLVAEKTIHKAFIIHKTRNKTH